MCGTHPVYEGASVSVNADSCRVSVPQIIATQVVLFGCDFPEDKYSKVQTRTDIPILFSVYDEIDGEPMLEFLKAVTEPVADAYKHDGFTTFEALCEEKTIEIDNSFFEESRMGKPNRPTD